MRTSNTKRHPPNVAGSCGGSDCGGRNHAGDRLDVSRARKKAMTDEGPGQTRCEVCGKPARPNKTTCARCERQQIYRQRIATGICTKCGGPGRLGRICCEECGKRDSAKTIKRTAGYVNLGLCYRCGATPLETFKDKPPAARVCESCYLKRISHKHFGSGKYWQILRDKLVSQDYRCVYTGALLKLGDNATLDHIFPSSRFPEKKRDIRNIQWICQKVNDLKGSYTPDELLALVKSIFDYRFAK